MSTSSETIVEDDDIIETIVEEDSRSSSSSESEDSQEKDLVVKDKSVKICDGSFVPEEYRKNDELIESILNINKDNVTAVFEGIQPEQVKTAYKIIESVIEIRPLQVENLLSLFSLLAEKHGYEKEIMPGKIEKLLVKKGIIPNDREFDQSKEIDEILYGPKFGKIENAIKEDNLESFIEFSTEPTFDPTHTITFNDLFYSYDYALANSFNNSSFSYVQLMAFFGSVKCFKHAILTGDFDLKDIQNYAIAGGNTEIIHIIENKGISFDNCFGFASKLYRNELCDWLLLHYKCEMIGLPNIVNYKLTFFLINNTNWKKEIDHSEELFECYQLDHDFFIYLNEILHIKYNSSFYDAIYEGNLELVKCLYETGHVEVDEKDEEKTTPINRASQEGHFEIVKYLYETCHADIEIRDSDGSSPMDSWNDDIRKYIFKCLYERNYQILNRSKNDSLDLIKYLIETCHASVPDELDHLLNWISDLRQKTKIPEQ